MPLKKAGVGVGRQLEGFRTTKAFAKTDPPTLSPCFPPALPPVARHPLSGRPYISSRWRKITAHRVGNERPLEGQLGSAQTAGER